MHRAEHPITLPGNWSPHLAKCPRRLAPRVLRSASLSGILASQHCKHHGPSVPDESLSLDLVAFIHLRVQLVLAVSGPRRPARGAELGVLSPGPGGLHAAPARHQARARLTVRGRHQQVNLGISINNSWCFSQYLEKEPSNSAFSLLKTPTTCSYTV